MRLRRLRKGLSSLVYILGRVHRPLQKYRLWITLVQTRWRDIEYFDDTFRQRVNQMAEFVPKNATVMDLGCGKCWLREIVGSEHYTGIDYRPRGEETIICDFNERQFPEIRRDVAFVSGCLEYIDDYQWFIQKICEAARMCILSYCPVESYADLGARRRAGWVNHLTIEDIKREFCARGFYLSAEAVTPLQNAILVLSRSDPK
jgi:hypothetical protein